MDSSALGFRRFRHSIGHVMRTAPNHRETASAFNQVSVWRIGKKYETSSAFNRTAKLFQSLVGAQQVPCSDRTEAKKEAVS